MNKTALASALRCGLSRGANAPPAQTQHDEILFKQKESCLTNVFNGKNYTSLDFRSLGFGAYNMRKPRKVYVIKADEKQEANNKTSQLHLSSLYCTTTTQ